MSDIPKEHPRYESLRTRALLEAGIQSGITTVTGLIAHGRGEAFDYLLGEATQRFAEEAALAAAAMLRLAKHPVISVNGNTAMLVREEMIALSRATKAPLEINLFHDAPERREKIAQHFLEKGEPLLAIEPDAMIPGLSSARARVDSRGIYRADVVLVSLEDGDRTEVLRKSGKKVIAIDLNPLSRTPQMADISIIDNVLRALPLLKCSYEGLGSQTTAELEGILSRYSNRKVLEAAIQALRSGAKLEKETA